MWAHEKIMQYDSIACCSVLSQGTTKPLAEYAAEYLNADLYEIKAETPYTSEDLDYNASGSRANKEQDDASARPAISGKVEDMDKNGENQYT